jgi:hypothetical protein
MACFGTQGVVINRTWWWYSLPLFFFP